MEIVKKNLVNIICGTVALLAIVAAFYPMGGFFTSLETKLNESKSDYQAIKTIKGDRFKLPITALNQTETGELEGFPGKAAIEKGKAAVKLMRDQCLAAAHQAMAMNVKKPLVEGLFPNNVSGDRRFEFKRRYHERMRQFRDELNATSPPTEEDVQKEKDRIWEATYKPMIASGRNEQDVTAEFTTNEAAKIPERLQLERARKHSIYLADPLAGMSSTGSTSGGTMVSGMGLDYSDRIPPTDVGDLPFLVDIWAAQLGLWIQEDVVTAIKKINQELGQPDPATKVVSIENAPVKRLVRVDIPKAYVTKSGPLPIVSGMESAASTALPGTGLEGTEESGGAKVYTYSFTGRVCNPLYDVMHFTVVADVDARHFQAFMARLCEKKFITILEAHMLGVDREQAKLHGMMYGKQPVVQLTLKCEAIFFRDWTIGKVDPEKPEKQPEGLMPQDIRKMLGITPPGGDSVASLQ